MIFMINTSHKTFVLLFSITILPFFLLAQTLTVKLPFYANKEVALVVQNGVQKDTVQKLLLNPQGVATFNSGNLLQRPGLVILSLSPEISFTCIASPKETIIIESAAENLSVQNVHLEGAFENHNLDKWFGTKVVFQQKINSLNTLLQLYEPNSNFYSTIAQEKVLVAGQQALFSDTLKASNSFAAGFIQIRAAFETFITNSYKSSAAQASTRQYLLEVLDLETLYSSNMWFDVLNGCVGAYAQGSAYHQKFGEDMVTVLKTTKSDDVFMALADAAISMCEKFAWTQDEEVLVNYLVSTNRLLNPQGKLKKLLQLKSTQVGSKAPNLMLVKNEDNANKNTSFNALLKTENLSPKFSLLLFHETGCPNCERAISELKSNYEELVRKGLRIISMSADTHEATFKATSSQLPWKDAYCDYKGFGGENFLNYAIIATPTMFVLNNKGIIQAKLASAQEVLDWIKEK